MAWVRCGVVALLVIAWGPGGDAQTPGTDPRAVARALARDGRLDAALSVYTRILEAAPEDLDTRKDRARVLGWLGRPSEALAEYDRVLAVTPRDLEARLGQGRVLGWLGRASEAEAALRQAVLDNPAAVEAHTALGDLLSRQRREGEAVGAYNQARVLAPDDPHPIVGLARLSLGQGDVSGARALYAEALTLFTRILDHNPHDVDARTGRARVLTRLGRHPEALADYDRALATVPRDAETRIGRGRVLSVLGRIPEAEAEFRHAVALDPRSAEAYTALGDVLSRQQRRAEAGQAYEAARGLAPESVEPVLGLARLRLWQEDLAGAKAGYEAALRLDPRNADALEGLARIAAIPSERRFRLDINSRYEALSDGRSDWYETTGRLTLRVAKRTRLFVGVDQYHRNDADDTQVTLGGVQSFPGDVTLSAAFAIGIDAEVVARQVYEVELGYRLRRWATPLLAYRHSNFPGGVDADVVTPGVELTWGSFLSVLARYYFVRSSDAGDSHAGASRFTFFPEARVSPHVGISYGRETFLAETVEEVVRGVNVLTLSAGVVWRLTEWTGVRIDYAYEDRQDSYTKHGVGIGFFYLF